MRLLRRMKDDNTTIEIIKIGLTMKLLQILLFSTIGVRDSNSYQVLQTTALQPRVGWNNLIAGSCIPNRFVGMSAAYEDDLSEVADTTVSTSIHDDIIQHPVLKNVFSKMIQYKNEYGHPNIPLPEGKGLETLRRLHIQGKLSDKEIQLLEEIGFRFHSLEDVYDYADFDEMFNKLLLYAKENGNVSPPKKYKYDPELGAWVTGIRRRGPENVSTVHRDQLNEVGFQWTSPRQCGSSFMQQYRSILERQKDGEENVLNDETVKKWIQAMQKTTLSETRQHYMETLLGKDWKLQ